MTHEKVFIVEGASAVTHVTVTASTESIAHNSSVAVPLPVVAITRRRPQSPPQSSFPSSSPIVTSTHIQLASASQQLGSILFADIVDETRQPCTNILGVYVVIAPHTSAHNIVPVVLLPGPVSRVVGAVHVLFVGSQVMANHEVALVGSDMQSPLRAHGSNRNVDARECCGHEILIRHSGHVDQRLRNLIVAMVMRRGVASPTPCA
mmetsp:Transcript_13907/g.38205  ORF Transcript_13907/g.38205 Transcript_13907/m.38205 type:complete len:206 (-) Transcript_13907:395-1012(-)